MNWERNQEILQRIVQTGLATAREHIAAGEVEKAESVLLATLELAEMAAGKSSALAGLVVLDLFDFYENQCRWAEAEPLWQRLREILILNLRLVRFKELPPVPETSF